MKTIPENSQQAWNSKLFNDLVFIKKHKRYPLSKATTVPLLGVVVFLGLFLRFCLVFISIKSWQEHLFLFIFMLFSILIIPSYITIRKYFLLFHFHEIKNNNSLEENVDLVSQFLSEQHFVAYCHPLAPEIFQIFSKNIDPFGDEREVLVFIADENRFLINSHFTSSKIKYKIFISPSRQREVIKAFKGWLKTKTLNKELAVTKHANNSAI